MDADYALKALNDAQAVKLSLADRARCPPHWSAAFSGLMGTMIAGEAAPAPWTIAILALCMVGVVVMMRAARRRMGFFVNGYRKGRTRRVALGLLAFVETILIITLWLKLGRHIWWAPLVGGALVAPLAFAGSYAWQAAYRADLTEGAARG